MSYLVLARKYRPQTFAEVVGQDHVTTTLSNSITAGRVAHAILFSGPRGTGKTTVARVLAKTINCELNRETPTSVPCNSCRSCIEITSGSAADVFEIDGASNNSVDQVRELRDNVRYMPAYSPFKIYIIDEVHMLSIAAFNALLKTLEEPPQHVKFMFATTEPHKIPITILSRCQRHDMRRVELDKVVGHLNFLCQQENVVIEERSLNLIAQESGGSMRDALSLLDQVISCSIGDISHDQVLNILGTVDRQNLFDISFAILNKSAETILTLINDIYNQGHDLKKLYASITSHFRNLVVVKMTKTSTSIIDLPEHEISLLKEQTANIPVAFLTQIMDLLFNEEAAIRFSSQPKIAVEIALLKLLQIEPALSIETLIEKLDLLQKNVGGHSEVESPEPKVTHNYSGATQEQQPSSVNEAPQAFSNTQVPTNQNPENSHSQKETIENNIVPDHFQQQTQQTSVQNPPQSVTASNFNPVDTLDVSWNKFRNWLATINRPLAPSLSDSVLKKLSSESIEIEVRGSKFNIQRVLNNKNKPLIENACRQFFRTDANIILSANYQQVNENKQKKEKTDQLKQDALQNPVIAETVKLFNGHIDTKIL